jgi:hypothetical protein
LNELQPIWPLDTLLNPKKIIELKKIKQCYYLWKKCFGKDNERVNEWNAQAKEIIEQQNQCKIVIGKFVESHEV